MTVDYPNELQPPGQGHDRIVICEDTDGDGQADKFTVFADKLSIPTSMMFARGGVIVFDATQTVFLKDTDGDGKADVREVLFGTWSHAGHARRAEQHAVRPGQLDLGHAGVQLVAAPARRRNAPVPPGLLSASSRTDSPVSKLEFLRSTNNNTWGLGISEEGIVFGSTANGNPSVYMPIPNRYYEAVRGWSPSLVLHTIADTHLFKPITDKIRQVDYHGGYTAAAGHALYTARTYPQEYWNRTAFVSEPTGHLVGTFVLRREGSDFHSSNPFNLLASDDEWTAPIMAEVGPDGNVWVIDWYNYIVQHNPTPAGFKTGKGGCLRDRPARQEAWPHLPGRLRRTGPDQGRETLYACRRDAAEAGRDAQATTICSGAGMRSGCWWSAASRTCCRALLELAGDPSMDEIGLNVGVIHALWTMHGLGRAGWLERGGDRGRRGGTEAPVGGGSPQRRSGAAARADVGHGHSGQRAARRTRRPGAAGGAAGPGRSCRPCRRPARRSSPCSTSHGIPPIAGFPTRPPVRRPTNADSFLQGRWRRPDATICKAARCDRDRRGALRSRRPGRFRPLTSVAAPGERGSARSPPPSFAGLAKGWPATSRRSSTSGWRRTCERMVHRLAPEQRGLLIRAGARLGKQELREVRRRGAGFAARQGPR